MKIKNKIIIIGCNHTNTLGIVRSLGEKGIRPICVLHGNDSGLIFDSKYPEKCIYQPNVEECLKLVKELFSNEEYKPIILPSEDISSSLMDLHYDELKDKFCIHNAGKQGRITHFMDKGVIGTLGAKHGFKIPKFWYFTKEEDDISQVTYPCFVKADKTINGGKKAEEVCYNEKELRYFLDSINLKRLLIQQYIDKKNELCCQGFSIKNGEEIYIPFHETFLQFTSKAFGGYVVLKKNIDKERDAKIQAMLQEIGFTGMFSAEFLIDNNDEYYFTEINLRHDGFSYFTTTGGGNLPYLFCKSTINGHIDTSSVKLKNKIIGLNEMYYYGQAVKTGEVSLFNFIWRFLTSDSHLLFNIKDLKPILGIFTRRFFRK